MRHLLSVGFKPLLVNRVELEDIKKGWTFVTDASEHDLPWIKTKVGSEENPLVVLFKEFPYFGCRVSTEFGDSCRNVDNHVWVGIEKLVDLVYVFGIICEVYSDKLRLGVVRKDPIPRVE